MKAPAAAIGLMTAAGAVCAQTQKELLEELDRMIEEAGTYVTAKELCIKTIETPYIHVESPRKGST